MGAIVDFLLLGKFEIAILERRYPDCVIRNMTNSQQLTQKYRVIIPRSELGDDYYHFLVDHRIALSSQNFRMRLESDPEFKERMAARAEANRHWFDQEAAGKTRRLMEMGSGAEASSGWKGCPSR